MRQEEWASLFLEAWGTFAFGVDECDVLMVA